MATKNSINNKTGPLTVTDSTDITKEVTVDVSGVTTATTRTWTVDDRDIDFDAVPTSITTDSGTCTPASGAFSVVGASGPLSTSGAGSTTTLDTSDVLKSDSGFEGWSGGAPYFDDTTLGQFTVSQAGTGYIKGVQVTWTAPQTVTGMTAGNTYYIYIDNTGTIGKTTSYSDTLFSDYIVLFECLRDSTTGTNIQVTVKENHPFEFPWKASVWAHDTIGPVISDKQGGANITLNGTQKIEISGADELEDHGLETTIPDSGGVAETFEQYYTLGSGKWARNAQSDTFDGTWNNAGTPTAIGSNKYTVNRLYVSKDNLNSATPVYFSVMGDAEYNNLAAADTAIANDSIPTATGELAALELAQLGYIVFEESTTSIVQVVIAKETARTSFSGVTATTASLVLTDTTNFDHILSAADTTVQSALETIDDLTMTTDSGSAQAASAVFTVAGGSNMNTAGATSTVTVNLDNSPSVSGSLTAGTGVTATTGDITASAGNLNLPTTNAALSEGVIEQNGTRIFHTFGTSNTFIGANAGNGTMNANAIRNIGIGVNALDNLSGASNDDDNVAIGYDALTTLQGGTQNIAIGTQSLKAATTALFNMSIGINSMLEVTSGERNSCLGNNALASITTGSYNVGMGNAAGSALTGTDSDNILISSSGTVGDNNTIRIGTQGTGNGEQDTCFIAGIYNTTPTGAVTGTVLTDASGQLGTVGDIIGTNNLNLPTTNAALTEGVIEINSTRVFHTYGTDNVFIGANAGNGTLSGSYNVSAGSGTLDALTTGNYNMAFGYNALTSVADGISNVAIGGLALEDVLDGSFNVGIGTEAGKSVTSGDSNMLIGRLAAEKLTTGSNNLAIGSTALGNLVSGSNNICLGNTGGDSLTTNDSDNICISNAGIAGDNNTIRIGTQGTGNFEQDTCFIAGIYNTTPSGGHDGSLIIDSNGQLGSLENVRFLAYLGSSDNNVTGAGTAYTLGTNVAFTEVYDIGSDFNTNGTFTAPVTGKYQINYSVLYQNMTASATLINTRVVTSNRSYQFVVDPNGTPQTGTSISVIADMDASDTCTFVVRVVGEASDVVDINGTSSPYNTHISGCLLS